MIQTVTISAKKPYTLSNLSATKIPADKSQSSLSVSTTPGGNIRAWLWAPGMTDIKKAELQPTSPGQFLLPILKAGDSYTLKVNHWTSATDSQTLSYKINAAEGTRLWLGACDMQKKNPALIVPVIKPLGLLGNRAWFNTDGFGKYKARDLSWYYALGKAGIETTFCFAESNLMPGIDPDAISRWTDTAVRDIKRQLPGVKFNIVMGNEIDLVQDAVDNAGKPIKVAPYWKAKELDGVKRYVQFLDEVTQYMHRSIKNVDDSILTGAPSICWNADTFVSTRKHAAQMSDFDTYHGYPKGIDLPNLRRYVPVVTASHAMNREVWIDEANVNRGGLFRQIDKSGKRSFTLNQWGDEIMVYFDYLADIGIDRAFYFTLFASTDTTNSVGGLLNVNGSQITKTPTFEAIEKVQSAD